MTKAPKNVPKPASDGVKPAASPLGSKPKLVVKPVKKQTKQAPPPNSAVKSKYGYVG